MSLSGHIHHVHQAFLSGRDSHIVWATVFIVSKKMLSIKVPVKSSYPITVNLYSLDTQYNNNIGVQSVVESLICFRDGGWREVKGLRE
jgi:hypothetical protein